MAYTLTEVQTVLTNLKASYLSLTTKLAQSFSARDRQMMFVQMKDMRKEIEEWEAREQILLEANAGQAPGVVYANFQRPNPS
jgi:hypothetical protein